MSAVGQTKKVVVRGWSIADKAEIVGLGEAADASAMGDAELGSELASQVFGEVSEVVVHKPVNAQAEADQIAKGIFNHMNLQFIKADGECLGNSALRAGEVVALEKIGQGFSGPYYLTSTRHLFDEDGYRTVCNCNAGAGQSVFHLHVHLMGGRDMGWPPG